LAETTCRTPEEGTDDMSAALSAEELYSQAEQANERGDYATALSSYRQAAEKGDIWAMIRMGEMYYDGKGVPKDGGEAGRWIAKAAEAGGAETMSDVGSMYLRGKGLPKDCGEALRWLRRAAELGHAHAMLDLGTMYERGEGVPQDLHEAIRLYRQAAECKDRFGARKLALMCLARLGVR
jgi:TPR repeat protein